MHAKDLRSFDYESVVNPVEDSVRVLNHTLMSQWSIWKKQVKWERAVQSRAYE